MSGRAIAALPVVIGIALLLPAGAQGTVTIGSNLNADPNVSFSCNGPVCTWAQNDLVPAEEAAGGVKSPVSGTVLLWRVRTRPGTQQPLALRVVRPVSTGALYSGAAISATVTPPGGSITPYTTALPIKAGDLIGIDCCAATSYYFRSPVTQSALLWKPALADGDPGRAPTDDTYPFEIMVNADIEPTSAFTIDAVKPGKGGKLTVTATLPNPGVYAGGDVRDPSLAAAAAGKKKTRYLKSASLPVGIAGQTIRLLLNPTKAARSVLDDKGKLKTKAKLVFTPTGGSPSSQVIKAKLKR